MKVVHFKRLTIDGLHMDYVHAAETQRAEAERAKATVNTAQSINAKEDTLVRVDRIKIVGGELGFVNQAAKPEYRLYLADADLTLEHTATSFAMGPRPWPSAGNSWGPG